jgi:tetratricopeptide (TPR) repeat protein
MRHKGRVNRASFSQDGRWVVTASADGTARVWEAASGKHMGKPLLHQDEVIGAVFSPDGRWVVTNSRDKTARAWETTSGNPVGKPMQHRSEVSSASFSPDGRWVVTASAGTARVWEAASGQAVGQAMRHEGSDGWFSSAAFSPDGRWVVTALGDKTARLWEAATGKPVGEPMHHVSAVNSAVFSPNGRWILTASEDRTARVWEASSGKPVSEPMPHKGPVKIALFSPDGRWVVSATGAPYYQLDLSPGKFIEDWRLFAAASGENITALWMFEAVEAKECIIGLTEALFGLTVEQNSGVLTPLDSIERLADLRKRYPRSWFFQNPLVRPIGPMSPVTVAEWIDKRLMPTNETARIDLEDAYPTHPLSEAGFAVYYAAVSNPRDLPKAALLAKVVLAAEPGIMDASLKAKIRCWLSVYASVTGQPAQARDHIERAIKFDSKPARYWKQLATVHEDTGDDDSQLEALNQALNREATNAFWLVRRGRLLGRRRDLTAAKSDFQRALTAQPNDLEIRRWIGWCHLDLAQWEDALLVFEQLRSASTSTTEQPLDQGLFAGRAAAAWLAGRREDARYAYAKLVWNNFGFLDCSYWDSTNQPSFSIRPLRTLPLPVRQALSNVCVSLGSEKR